MNEFLFASMKTPQQSYPELAQALHVPEIWLKREDLHPYGSHKGRSIPVMIKDYFKMEGLTSFVISSSGNAALAAATTVKKHNQNNPQTKISLQIFVGKNIDVSKLKKLRSLTKNEEYIVIEQVENPKQNAFQIDTEGKAKFLRQSTDDSALKGYVELAMELDKIPNLQAIFIPTSSGTTAQAIGEAFVTLSQKPQIHIVQTEACHPMAEVFQPQEKTTPTSLASAIVDKIAHRKEKVIEQIKKSNGSGWIVSDTEIQNAKALVQEKIQIDISFNSALSLAGLQKAVRKSWKFEGAVVCLITGK